MVPSASLLLCVSLSWSFALPLFMKTVICFFYGTAGLSMLILGVLLFIQGVAWIAQQRCVSKS